MRLLTVLLLACVVLAPAAHAADFAFETIAEAAEPDGSIRPRQVEVHPDGGVVFSALSNSGGGRVVMRLDAQGNELWRRVSPGAATGGFESALDVRADGVVGIVEYDGQAWFYSLLDAAGGEIARHALGLGREVARFEPAMPLADGFAVFAEVNGPPWRVFHRYNHAGVALAGYSDSASGCGMKQVRPRAGGGFVVRGCAGLSGGRVRVLDDGLRPVWTVDVGSEVHTLEGTIDGPGGTMLAFGYHQRSPTSSQGAFALLGPDGNLAWSALTPEYPAATNVPWRIRLAPYSHDGGFGFVGTAGNPVSGSCLLQGTLTASGALASGCDPLPLVDRLEPPYLRRVPGGVDMLLIARDGSGRFGQFVSKRGGAPAVVLDARWNDAPMAYGFTAAISDSGPVALIKDEVDLSNAYDISRLVRWEQGAQPVVDRPLPGDDAPHFGTLLVDSTGGVLHAFAGRDHVDVLRRDGTDAQDWQRRLPLQDGDAKLAEAADGSFRVLSGGTTPQVVALSRDGTPRWTYRFGAPVDALSRMAAPADGTTLVAYATREQACRVRRLDALGNVTGDGALGAEGYVMDSAPLDDGAVFTCAPIVYFEEIFYGPEIQVRVDAALSARIVDTAGCRIAGESRIVALGGTRWIMTGRALEPRNKLRFCVFDDAHLVQSAVVEFGAIFTPLLHLGVHVDRARGKVHVAGTLHLQPSLNYHVIYDIEANSATAHPLHGNGMLMAMSGPDSAGRIAHVYNAPNGRIIELGFPALGADWRSTLPTPAYVTRLAMAGNRLRFAAADSQAFDRVVYHLGVARADVLFDSGFESP